MMAPMHILLRALCLPATLVGPIFAKELRVSSRRRRNYVLRAGYLVLLLLFVLLVWQAAVRWDNYYGNYAFRVNKMAEAGRIIVTCIVCFQFVMVQFVAVVMLSNSISEEIYKRTLGVLMTTPIVSLQIVTGKLFSKLLQLLMLLALSLPLLAVVRVFGGVPWEYVVAGTCLTLTAALFAAAVSMFFSILFRHAFVSILLTLAAGLLLYGIVPLIGSLVVAAMRIPGSSQDLTGLLSVAIHTHPFWSMGVCTMELMEPRATAFLPGFHWWINCIVMLSAAMGVLLACVAMVRRVGLRQACGGTPSAMSLSAMPQPAALFPPLPAAPAAALVLARDAAPAADEPLTAELPPAAPLPALPPPIPPGPVRPVRLRTIWGSPVLWRELRAVAIRSRVARWIVYGAAGLLLLVIYTLCASFDRSFTDNDAHAVFVFCLSLIAAVATAIYTAVNITAEKEAGTWEMLLVTPLGDWHVLLAKAAGCVRRCLPFWLLPIGHVAVFVVIGMLNSAAGRPNAYLVHPIVPVHVAMVAVSVIALFTGSGLLLGTWLKRTTTAVVLNLALGLALWAVLPGALALLAEGIGITARDEMRELAECAIDANPLYQAGELTSRASGEYNANKSLKDLSYHLEGTYGPWISSGLGAGIFQAFIAAGYIGLGVVLFILARVVLRKRKA